jgi:predicted nucleic acid-binding protein
VKLLVEEPESDHIRSYLLKNPTYHYHITEFAFYETLSVLKQKLVRREIDKHRYHSAVVQLSAYVEDEFLEIDSEFRPNNFNIIFETRELVTKYGLDYSDALQIYTVLHAERAHGAFNCKAVFVTTDSILAEASKKEGLRVWNPLETEKPPSWDRK